LNTGTEAASEGLERILITLSNKLSLLLIPFVLFPLVLSDLLGFVDTLMPFVLFLCLIFAVFVLNRFKLNLAARLMLSALPPIFLLVPFTFGDFTVYNQSFTYAFLGIVLIPLVLFFKRSELTILTVILILHLSALSFYTLFLGLGDESDILINFFFPQVFLWIFIVIAIKFLNLEGLLVQKKLQETNEALVKSNLEINTQKEEIEAQNEFLNTKQIQIEEQSAHLLKSNHELINTKVELLKMIERLEEAKESLKKKEAEASSIVKALDNHYIVAQFSPEGNLISINHKMIDLFGELEPDMMSVRTLPDQRELAALEKPETGTIKAIWPEILKGKAISLDIEIPLPQGNKYFSTTLAPLFDPNEKPYGVLAIGQDISELYDKKEKINTINEELKEKISEISQQNELLNFQQLEIFNKNEELRNQSQKISSINDELKEKINEISQQNELLNFQQLEIFNKNEELRKQSQKIKSINETLEIRVKERTQVLEEKNKQLAEYAFINSHVLRAPVSTMLGLINLISYSALPIEDQKIYRHLLETANVLDSIVYKINNAIDGDSHFDRNYLEPERDFQPMSDN